MDPNATLRNLLNALADGDRNEAASAANALTEWLMVGGAAPTVERCGGDGTDPRQAFMVGTRTTTTTPAPEPATAGDLREWREGHDLTPAERVARAREARRAAGDNSEGFYRVAKDAQGE